MRRKKPNRYLDIYSHTRPDAMMFRVVGDLIPNLRMGYESEGEPFLTMYRDKTTLHCYRAYGDLLNQEKMKGLKRHLTENNIPFTETLGEDIDNYGDLHPKRTPYVKTIEVSGKDEVNKLVSRSEGYSIEVPLAARRVKEKKSDSRTR